tara:strand:- start:784 stop:969 length:186 start_codon:yes stop_codon:yes gene_type:complete
MERVEQAIALLSQVIEKSSIDDKVESSKDSDIAQDGDGWITHNLKLVKELLEQALEDKNNA